MNNSPPVVTLAAPLDGAKYRDGVPVQLSGVGDRPRRWRACRLAALVERGARARHPPASVPDLDRQDRQLHTHDRPRRRLLLPRDADRDRLRGAEHVQDRGDPPAGGEPLDRQHAGCGRPDRRTRATRSWLLRTGRRPRSASAPRCRPRSASSRMGAQYEFTGWSDGGAIAHDLTIPATRPRPRRPVPRCRAGREDSRRLRPRARQARATHRVRRGEEAGAWAGSVSDASGVKNLKVALRSRARGGCRWWNAKAGHLSRKRTRCKRPRWIKAALKQAGTDTWTWTVRLGGRLPAGRYKLAFRATDGAGNVSTALATGRSASRDASCSSPERGCSGRGLGLAARARAWKTGWVGGGIVGVSDQTGRRSVTRLQRKVAVTGESLPCCALATELCPWPCVEAEPTGQSRRSLPGDTAPHTGSAQTAHLPPTRAPCIADRVARANRRRLAAPLPYPPGFRTATSARRSPVPPTEWRAPT